MDCFALSRVGHTAVDRLSDDYPILLPRPTQAAECPLDEIIRYSPKKVDTVNLQTKHSRPGFPARFKNFVVSRVDQLVSTPQDHIHVPSALGIDFEMDECVVTFEGLVSRTPFIEQTKTILQVLQEALGYPVDIEFAHDGVNFYLFGILGKFSLTRSKTTMVSCTEKPMMVKRAVIKRESTSTL
jgi:hypothetical protein